MPEFTHLTAPSDGTAVTRKDGALVVPDDPIIPFTEGAFRDWGYELAKEEFGDRTIGEWDGDPDGKVVMKDRIADSMLQQILTRTADYDVIATSNLNGDYLSDACAAQSATICRTPARHRSAASAWRPAPTSATTWGSSRRRTAPRRSTPTRMSSILARSCCRVP